MMTKMFGLYPPRPDVAIALSAYIEETRSVPVLVLSHALKRLVERRESPYVPSVFEILRMSARVLREWKRVSEGKSAEQYNPNLEPGQEPEIDVARWLGRAPDVMRAIAAGERPRELVDRATPEQRAAGAALLEQLAGETTRRMRAPQ